MHVRFQEMNGLAAQDEPFQEWQVHQRIGVQPSSRTEADALSDEARPLSTPAGRMRHGLPRPVVEVLTKCLGPPRGHRASWSYGNLRKRLPGAHARLPKPGGGPIDEDIPAVMPIAAHGLRNCDLQLIHALADVDHCDLDAIPRGYTSNGGCVRPSKR